jgi:uncharacterized protein YifN (PemK superfamily)
MVPRRASHLLANWVLDRDVRFQVVPLKRWHLYRGHIVAVQLGYGPPEEFSFRHPCVVLKAFSNSVVVVPMTSKRYGQGISTVAAVRVISATTPPGA